MGRYTGPSCRLCRRAGEKLFLKGCAIERRHIPPGGGGNRRRRVSDYGVHLREKQKARQMYGVMEGQFRKYMTDAFNTPGISGNNLLRTLERRLDNVVFLLGFADSRKQARQMVQHGHFTINGRKTDIPSFMVTPGQTVAWTESSRRRDFFAERTEGLPKRTLPSWLTLDLTAMVGQVVSLPPDNELPDTINSRLIVEFYSR
ncbi:30S ribosomal protein S4 [Geodia barretti]|uniref:30S ribosomal protein S4 n=1 Tax=Geodia barretti TaxID=519541 RepID=A0AA35SL04_GEOBA|nr:30S ribosomal protein S4 [Geodia barretti]